MVITGFSSELHVRRRPDIVQVHPSGYILEEQTRDHWFGQIKQVVNRQHRLHKVVFAQIEIVLGCMNGEFILIQLNTKTVQCHLQQVSSIRRFEITAGSSQILDDVAIIGKDESVLVSLNVKLKIVVVTVEVRSRNFNKIIYLAQGGFVLKPRQILIHQPLHFLDHEKSPRRMIGGSVTLQYRMKSSKVSHRSFMFGIG